jgi:hypothetical protein
MLHNASFETSQGAESRTERRRRILAELQAKANPLLEQMADTLVDAPDRELFRSVELKARDLGQQLAATAVQAGLDDRKKGGTAGRASSVPPATATPAS